MTSSEIERRAELLAEYIVEHGTTVRATAAKFGISKSTVHMAVTVWNGSYGGSNKPKAQHMVVEQREQGLRPLLSLYP